MRPIPAQRRRYPNDMALARQSQPDQSVNGGAGITGLPAVGDETEPSNRHEILQAGKLVETRLGELLTSNEAIGDYARIDTGEGDTSPRRGRIAADTGPPNAKEALYRRGELSSWLSYHRHARARGMRASAHR